MLRDSVLVPVPRSARRAALDWRAHVAILPMVTALPAGPGHRQHRPRATSTRSKTACCGSSAAPAWSPPKSPSPRPRDAPAFARATCCWRSMVSRSAARARCSPCSSVPSRRASCLHAAAAGHRARSSRCTLAPLPSGAGAALLRPGRGRHLHAAGRRGGAGAAARSIRRRCTSSGCAVAFFGAFTFSFSGRLRSRRLVLLLGRRVAIALLPPLFLHFALVFPERPHPSGYAAHAGALAAGDLSAGRRARLDARAGAGARRRSTRTISCA